MRDGEGQVRRTGLGEATRIIRGTLTAAEAGAPLHAGPVFAAPFHSPEAAGEARYSYGRSHNPTWTELEEAIGRLEVEAGQRPAKVRCFGSGIAAVAAVFGAVLVAGDTVAIADGAYFTARLLLKERLTHLGVRVRELKAAEMTDAAALTGVKLLWAETPSNPRMEIVDLRAVAEAAGKAGALVAVDNTTATPLGQRPLELGADFSVSSDSKAMCGHGDLLAGHVAVRSAALLEQVDRERTLTGGILGPMEAWLLTRSLATLPLRLARSSANALGLAEFLAGRPEVGEVLYPGLKGHPGREVAAGQMRHFGPVLGFDLGSREAAERFFARAELVTEATSFGGMATTAERRARWGGDAVGEGFIRMSAGCEDLDDLVADVGQALAG